MYIIARVFYKRKSRYIGMYKEYRRGALLYHNKKIHYYLPQENVTEEMFGDQIITGTDSNTETVHIYCDDGTATEEDVRTYNYSPNEE